MSNLLYSALWEQVIEDYPNGINPFEVAEKIDQLVQESMTLEWSVGFHDRGMGRGDFGVIVKSTEALLFECGPLKNLADHLVKVHNDSLLKPQWSTTCPDEEHRR